MVEVLDSDMQAQKRLCSFPPLESKLLSLLICTDKLASYGAAIRQRSALQRSTIRK